MKKELDRAMKKLEANLPEGILISLEHVRNRFSSGNKNETYRVYIASTDRTEHVFSIETKTAMEAVDDALVKFSQQLEEAATHACLYHSIGGGVETCSICGRSRV